MRAVLFAMLAATQPACAARATPQPPAHLDVACVATPSGASCVFSNQGGTRGARCVTVLAGRRGAPTVAKSAPLCSGDVDAGSEVTRTLTLTPALACATPDACLVRTADPGREDEIQAVLGDELAAPPTGPVTGPECDTVAAHIFDLTFAEATALKTQDERAQLARELEGQRDLQVAGYRDACLRRVTRAQLVCALAATDTTELRHCDEVH